MARLSMLAEIMNQDLERATELAKSLDVGILDLKNHIFGRPIQHLDDGTRRRLAALLRESGAEVYCFASTLGHLNVGETGETSFRQRLTEGVDNMLSTATFVRPRMIRLLACSIPDRDAWPDSNDYLQRYTPWVYEAYRSAIDRFRDAGILVTIENEPGTILSNPQETVRFFADLNAGKHAGFTWDIQNMWQSGTFPTMSVYRELRSVINYVHVKGGRGEPGTPHALGIRCPLQEAGWPVVDIVTEVLADGVSPVICINTSHGKVLPGRAPALQMSKPDLALHEARHDVAFLRRTFQEIS